MMMMMMPSRNNRRKGRRSGRGSRNGRRGGRNCQVFLTRWGRQRRCGRAGTRWRNRNKNIHVGGGSSSSGPGSSGLYSLSAFLLHFYLFIGGGRMVTTICREWQCSPRERYRMLRRQRKGKRRRWWWRRGREMRVMQGILPYVHPLWWISLLHHPFCLIGGFHHIDGFLLFFPC